MFKLFFSDKFGFASNIWSCLSGSITMHDVLIEIIMSHGNSDCETSWNLRFSTLESEPSSVFRLMFSSMLHQAGQFRNQLIQSVYF